MADLTPERVREALRAVLFPNFRRDVVTLGMVSDVRIDGSSVQVDLRPGTDKVEVHDALVHRIEEVVGRIAGVTAVRVVVAGAAEGRGGAPFAGGGRLPGGRQVVARSW